MVKRHSVLKLLNQPSKHVQSISGTSLCYTHSVDPTILSALNEIANQQEHPTESTANAREQLWILSTDILLPPFTCMKVTWISLVSDAAFLVLRCCDTLYTLYNQPTSNPP